ncbi:MAG: transglycosylase domain-containing protein [Candidatus Abawacabacteria bacterium]|nr:transglycosylase domain-containing protein [Candidatus Abawacabacteria bacterium]
MITAFVVSAFSNIKNTNTISQLTIYDRHHQVLAQWTIGNTKDQPQLASRALSSLLITEDQRFFSHNGIDILALARAVYERVSNSSEVSGASTITQQTSRSILGINRPRTFKHKAADILLAYFLHANQSKQNILAYYLTTTSYGNRIIGLSKAAQQYFSLAPTDLDWHQAILLAAIIKNPSDLTATKITRRKQHIAELLAKKSLISNTEKDSILRSPTPQFSEENSIIAPHFVYFVLSNLEEKWGQDFWHNKKVDVLTTLDSKLYFHNKSAIQEELTKLTEKNIHNAASIVINNSNGEVLSYVGSPNYFDHDHEGKVDMVQAPRQPGSALKPFIYLASILEGWGAGTIIYDIPSRFLTSTNTPYTPLNYDLEFHGPVTLRQALANSYNVPAVKALEFVGISKAKKLLEAVGISSLKESDDHYGLSLALGSGEVSLFELANAYYTLANLGRYQELQTMQQVIIDGQEVSFPSDLIKTGATNNQLKAAASLIINVLSDNKAREPAFDEYNNLTFDFPVAAKTGTSRNFNDNWTAGFSKQYTVGVWSGNADGAPMHGVSGITGAGSIFQRIMRDLPHTTTSAFTLDPSIETHTICIPSGQLPTKYCQHTVEELFVPHTAPQSFDTWYQADGLHLPTELNAWQKKFTTTTSLQTGITIVKPANHDIFQLDPEIPDSHESIPCEIITSHMSRLEITLNNQLLPANCQLPTRAGSYILSVSGYDQNGQKIIRQVMYQVE